MDSTAPCTGGKPGLGAKLLQNKLTAGTIQSGLAATPTATANTTNNASDGAAAPPSYSEANRNGPPHGGYYPGPITTQVSYYPTPSAGPYGAPPGMVAINPPPIFVHKPMGPAPELITCKACYATIVTRIDRKATMRTHLCAFGCCLLGLWPCALCVYCTHDCLSVEHYCPNCDAFLGRYDK